MTEDKEMEKKLPYTFSQDEVFLMAKFLRNNQESMPKGLENFYKHIEDFIYNSLSIEEAFKFYS